MDVNHKLVVYTALFGNYDNLIDPIKDYEGCDFICFTDRKDLKSTIWNIIVVDKIDLPLNMMNRKYKWLPHQYLKDYEISLYIDSNIVLLQNPIHLFEQYCSKNCLILLPHHPLRNCIYEESIACVERNKVTISNLLKQIRCYKKEKFPNNFGLGENNILFRKHKNQNVIHLMENLWTELNKWDTKRDQLSFFYLIWKNKFKNIVLMDENARDEKYFNIELHNKFKHNTFIKKVKNKLFYIKQSLINKNLYILINKNLYILINKLESIKYD
jgi:hypothetical protein